MNPLLDQLEAARATVAKLERQIAGASCRDVGHKWKSTGGANCGCDEGACSVPVHECATCGICDYGDNSEADDVRKSCKALESG